MSKRCCCTPLNREHYPRFYRGHYRLAMSLEMLANPQSEPGTMNTAALKEALQILDRCHVTVDAAKQRGVLRPYRSPRHRQAFHDGVCVALLLVAVRQAVMDGREAAAKLRLPRQDEIAGDPRAAANPSVALAVQHSVLDGRIQPGLYLRGPGR
jgi:hypothetical protein